MPREIQHWVPVMPNTAEMWVISLIDLTNDTSVGRGFVGTFHDRAMQSHVLNRFVEKGFCCICIPLSNQVKVEHLAICINCASQMAPFTTDAAVSLVYRPIDAGPAQKLFCSFGDLRAKFYHLPIHCRPFNGASALCKQINHVLIGSVKRRYQRTADRIIFRGKR